MKVLVDECAPRALKVFLAKCGHDCVTVQDAEWTGKRNGEILALAEGNFQAFVTLDTNVVYQQNLKNRTIAIIVRSAKSNRLFDLEPLFPRCADALAKIRTGDVIRIEANS